MYIDEAWENGKTLGYSWKRVLKSESILQNIQSPKAYWNRYADA